MTLETFFYLGFSEFVNLLTYADSELIVLFKNIWNLNDIGTEDAEIVGALRYG